MVGGSVKPVKVLANKPPNSIPASESTPASIRGSSNSNSSLMLTLSIKSVTLLVTAVRRASPVRLSSVDMNGEDVGAFFVFTAFFFVLNGAFFTPVCFFIALLPVTVIALVMVSDSSSTKSKSMHECARTLSKRGRIARLRSSYLFQSTLANRT